jgi:hypothetical protein
MLSSCSDADSLPQQMSSQSSDRENHTLSEEDGSVLRSA